MRLKLINAKFTSKCAETGHTIKKGELMAYDYDSKKCYSGNSSVMFAYGQAKDLSYSNEDANLVAAQENAYFDNFCQNNNIY